MVIDRLHFADLSIRGLNVFATSILMQPHQRIIVALDVQDAASALELAKQLHGMVGLLKVGLQLFTHSGPDVVRQLADHGEKLFLDLKLHDIPTTVMRAVASAESLGVAMMTIHLCGGADMLASARLAAGDQTQANFDCGIPLLLGVTVLTSMSQEALHSVGVPLPIEEQVLKLAELGFDQGIRGFVASPHEIAPLRCRFGDKIKIVTPGVRPEWSVKNDQHRVMTPREAIDAGADYIVVGRPVTAAPDPHEAVRKIIQELTV